MDKSTHESHVPWNKGKLIGQKAPLKPKDVWSIRIRLQIAQSRHSCSTLVTDPRSSLSKKKERRLIKIKLPIESSIERMDSIESCMTSAGSQRSPSNGNKVLPRLEHLRSA